MLRSRILTSNGLKGLAEAHIVGQDATAAMLAVTVHQRIEDELDTRDLMLSQLCHMCACARE